MLVYYLIARTDITQSFIILWPAYYWIQYTNSVLHFGKMSQRNMSQIMEMFGSNMSKESMLHVLSYDLHSWRDPRISRNVEVRAVNWLRGQV